VADTAPFTFLPEALVAKVVEPYYGTKEAQMVAGYESSTEVVVCFVGAGKGRRMDCYRFRSTPSPEQAADVPASASRRPRPRDQSSNVRAARNPSPGRGSLRQWAGSILILLLPADAALGICRLRR